jgi:hypothetical protein
MRSGAAVSGALKRGLAFFALFLAAPALAGPRTIDDCEAIKEANAYNLCLASFGPVRGQHGASYPGVATEGEKRSAAGTPAARTGAAPRRAGAALGYRGSFSQSRGGRVRMEFTPRRQ